MNDDVFPLKPAHPLAARADVSNPLSLLLYRGRMTGRWFDVSFTTTSGSGASGSAQPVKWTQAELDVSGIADVKLQLSPDPHLEWSFRHGGVSVDGHPVPMGEWPVMISPSSISGKFATRAGPEGPPALATEGIVSVGRRRVMASIEIGDRTSPLDEIRFYLVNFQVWFLIEHVTSVPTIIRIESIG